MQFDGPYTIRTPDGGGPDKMKRPAYIVVGFNSGVYTVYEPQIKIGGATYVEQYELAKWNKDETCLISWGKEHYFN